MRRSIPFPAAPPLGGAADQIIDEFLEGAPRSDTWRELRQTLADRLKDARATLSTAPENSPNRTVLEKKVRELREQVAALEQEEAITRFVEDSVRATVARPLPEFDVEEEY